MNFDSVNRLTSKEVRDMKACIVNQKAWTLRFVNNPDRHLKNLGDRIDALRGYLDAAEAEMADFQSLLMNHHGVVDAYDARIAELSNLALTIANQENIARLRRMRDELEAMGVKVTGDPDAVEEEMIVS